MTDVPEPAAEPPERNVEIRFRLFRSTFVFRVLLVVTVFAICCVFALRLFESIQGGGCSICWVVLCLVAVVVLYRMIVALANRIYGRTIASVDARLLLVRDVDHRGASRLRSSFERSTIQSANWRRVSVVQKGRTYAFWEVVLLMADGTAVHLGQLATESEAAAVVAELRDALEV